GQQGGLGTAAGRNGPWGGGFLGGSGGQVKFRRFSAVSGVGGSTGRFRTDLLVDVDIDRSAQHRAPGLQIGLHPRVACHLLPVQLERLMGFVLDLLHDALGIVHVLQEAHALAAERRNERPAHLQHGCQLGGVAGCQRELELQGASDRRGRLCHRQSLVSKGKIASRRCYRLMHASPKRTRVAWSASEAGLQEVNTTLADVAADAVGGPISSTTRRAIAGAGSMKLTGQGASRSRRDSSNGKCVQAKTTVSVRRPSLSTKQ